MDLQELVQKVSEVVREDGAMLRSLRHPKVYTKEGHANFVTEGDLASQKFLFERLEPLLPEAHFFAEEQDEHILQPGYNWLIDPIDGTTNFMRGYRPCSISVGLVKDGAGVLGVVYDVWGKELFSAVRGGGAFCDGEPIHGAEAPMENALIVFGTMPYYRELARPAFRAAEEVFLRCADVRRSGSAAIDLCSVAAGRADGFFEAYLSPWDYCAASVILGEAGASIGTLEGKPLSFAKGMPVIAGSSAVYETLLAVVGPHFGRK